MERKANNETQKSLSKVVINWFPGHMVKAINEIKSSLKLIDIVIEVVDCRSPIASHNYIIDEIAENKKRIIVMNKADLADDNMSKKWKEHFESKGMKVIFTNAQTGENIPKIISAIKELGDEIYKEKLSNKKVEMKPIYRVLIAGIPNVGKSTIINKLSKKNVVKVGNKPGVTTKKQWIRIDNNIELMDTPGILWPKLDENNAGIKLALTGNIKLEILDAPELAIEGIKFFKDNKKYTTMLKERYKLTDEDMTLETFEILEKIGKNRGCIVSKGEVDYERVAAIFLDEFKNGKIGKLTLDAV